MTSTSTLKNNIISFIYDENSIVEKEQLMTQMLINNDLYELYAESKFVKEAVDKVQFEPTERTINNILAYSRKTSVA